MSPNQGYPQQQDPRYAQTQGGRYPQHAGQYSQQQRRQYVADDGYGRQNSGYVDAGYVDAGYDGADYYDDGYYDAGYDNAAYDAPRAQRNQPRRRTSQQAQPTGRRSAPQRVQVQQQGMSAMAVVGLVLGIVALVFSWMPIVNNIAFFIAFVAVVFAIIGIIGTGAGKKRGRGIAVAGLVLAIISCVFVLGTQAMYSAAIDSATESFNDSVDRISGDATDEILGNDVDVKIGAFESTTDQYGIRDTSLPVTVTNLLDESKTYTIEIEAVDSNGTRIDTSTVYANSLGAGQSQTLEAFTYVTSDKLEQIEGAEFKVFKVLQY